MAVQNTQQKAQAEKASQELGLGTVEQAKNVIAPENLDTKKGFDLTQPDAPTENTRQQTALEQPTPDTADLKSKADTAKTGEQQSF